MTASRRRPGERLGVAIGAAALLLGPVSACRSPGETLVAPVALYWKAQDPWTPEDLHRDVIACTEEAKRARLEGAVPGWFHLAARLADARRDVSDATTLCMGERGWVAGPGEHGG